MKRLAVITLLVTGLTAFGCSNPPSSPSDAGWITLFDGSNLDNWNRTGDANWRIEGGLVVADRGDGLLVSKKTYTDFQIRAEFWVDDNANSGIYIRGSDPNKVASATAYEVNIFDKRPDPSYGTGAIVNVAKVAPMPKAGGKWNVYEITARGDRLTVVLNGVQTADVRDGKHPSGVIALQHGADGVGNTGVVKFRKVQIKPL
jgi:3-keto-disaccharide hydrolase